jgi:large subunit ribosomal protein L15
MNLSELGPRQGAVKKRKRIGRGTGSGHGQTSGKGHKGQKARSGGNVPSWFEGGQMPLIRRLPKRGFVNPSRKKIAIINLTDLNRFQEGSTVDFQALRQAGLVKGKYDGIKILGKGAVSHALVLRVQGISRSAREKIESSGGKVEII